MDNFDWVRSRASVPLPRIFEQLAVGIQGDVAARNEIARERGEATVFGAHVEGNAIVVTGNGGRSVRFVLDQTSIRVAGDAQFEAVPALYEANAAVDSPFFARENTATLIVNGIEFRLWMIRRMALEKLFFSDAPEKAQAGTA